VGETHRVVWAPVALDDLEEILDYIAVRDTASAAARVADKILKQIDNLARLPSRCRVVPELRAIGVSEYRELIIKPYRIVFRLEKRHVELVAVVDGRRDLEELLISRALR
jgi:plasmid stabilization system protein ParE